ncbi:MAG TPA: hypothetical protein VH143_02600 [Kofleriaceae bacterium]|nr:hypothetical protein [Kofleriaceae bacterium]
MKKCASCTKDLPEAALHCVFCGAKQPPAPAVQPGLAKTAFGYSNEMMEQLRSQGPAPTAQSPAPPMPVMQQPMIRPSAQVMPPPVQPSAMPGRGNPGTNPPPLSAANAATLFIDNNGPQPIAQQPAYAQPTLAVMPNNNMAMQATMAAPPPYGQPMRPSGPSQPPPYGQPMRPSGPSQPPPIFGMPANGYPASPPPAYAQRASMRMAAAVEPWRDSLKLVMIVWGLLVIAVLATPRSLDPLTFSWDQLVHGQGTARIPFLLHAALGVLGVIVALLPMPAIARGTLALVLGLAAIFVPIGLSGSLPEWHMLVVLVSMLLIVPGLLLRAAYTDSIVPRILVTLCVIAFIVPWVIPDSSGIPLVNELKALMDAPGKDKIPHVLAIARVALVVLSLLVWIPGPASAGGTVFAWLIMLGIGVGVSLVDTGIALALADDPVAALTKTPSAELVWIIPTACLAFVGYGLATVVGKQLE